MAVKVRVNSAGEKYSPLFFKDAADFSEAQTESEVHMKIVVVKSPRFLAGFLRLFFGIKKSQT